MKGLIGGSGAGGREISGRPELKTLRLRSNFSSPTAPQDLIFVRGFAKLVQQETKRQPPAYAGQRN